MDPTNMDEGRWSDGNYGQRIFVNGIKNNFYVDEVLKPVIIYYININLKM